MNAVSRFDAAKQKRVDAAKQKRGRIRLGQYALAAAYIAGGLLITALLFQLFFRYQYLEANGVTWRVDRLTQQTCKVAIGEAQCTPSAPAATVSTSTSTSTSTSMSLSVKAIDRKRGKPH